MKKKKKSIFKSNPEKNFVTKERFRFDFVDIFGHVGGVPAPEEDPSLLHQLNGGKKSPCTTWLHWDLPSARQRFFHINYSEQFPVFSWHLRRSSTSCSITARILRNYTSYVSSYICWGHSFSVLPSNISEKTWKPLGSFELYSQKAFVTIYFCLATVWVPWR